MLTRVNDQPAYLIHRRDWQNTSLILDMLTPDYGRISMLAKGGKNSKVKALYQPFIRLSVSWTGRHELKTLTGIDGVSLPVAEHHYLPLLYVNELVDVFLPKQEASEELFHLYESLLKKNELEDGDLREFEKEYMRLLGFLPDISIEAKSGVPVRGSSSYLFLPDVGFVLCESNDRHAIDGESIIAWLNGGYDDVGVAQMAKTVMRSIIDFNLQGKQLRSRDIYRQIKGHL